MYKCIIKLDWVCMCLCNAVILPVYYIFGIPHHVLSVASARGVVQCACSVQRVYKLLWRRSRQNQCYTYAHMDGMLGSDRGIRAGTECMYVHMYVGIHNYVAMTGVVCTQSNCCLRI